MNKLSQLISDGDGAPSLMRIALLLIIVPLMAVWAVLSVKAGQFVPLPWTMVSLVLGTLGCKAGQSFAENLGPPGTASPTTPATPAAPKSQTPA